MSEVKELLNVLAPRNGTKEGQADQNLFIERFMHKIQSTMTNMNSEKEFLEMIDYLEHLYESNPLVFNSIHAPFKHLSNRALILNDKINLKLEHQLRFASLFLPSTYLPTFFLPEIYKNTRDNFISVDSAVLYNFVDQANFRMN